MIDIFQLIAKYLPPDVKRPLTYRDHIIELANTQAPIHLILDDLYDIKVPEFSSSWKIHCPYGEEHKDGGRSPNCRVYSSSNSVFCFEQHFRMPPVNLYWRKYDHRSLFDAAKHVVADYSLQPPEEDYRERFARLSSRPSNEVYDIFEALQVLLSENSRYKKYQFESEILNLISLSRSQKPFADPIHATLDLYQTIETTLDRLEENVRPNRP